MPTFKYEARYPSGEINSGVIDALSENDAVNQLRKTYEVVLEIKEVPKTLSLPIPSPSKLKINMKNLALACKQFSIILQAGLPIVQTVRLVASQTSDKSLASLFNQIAEDVQAGWSLSYSLNHRAPNLPITFRETIHAGEESGDLVSAFDRMSSYYNRMNKTRSKTITTISYPALIIVVAIIVISIVMAFAVPMFTSTFESIGGQLPPITQALIAISNFFRQWIILILAIIIAIVVALLAFNKTENGALAISKVVLKLPIIGKIAQMGGASQFAHTMSAMIAAGMPILQALSVSGRTMDNKALSEEVLAALPGVEDGRTVGESLAATAKQLPAMLIQMVTVGESTGSMEDTLNILANYYDNEVDVKTERALALLEPIIIVCLSIFVVFILLAVYLPMFSMYSMI